MNLGTWIICFSDETQRRITLLPERLHEDNKVALKNIFGSLTNVLEELSNKEANDILVRASPKEVSLLQVLLAGYYVKVTDHRSQSYIGETWHLSVREVNTCDMGN